MNLYRKLFITDWLILLYSLFTIIWIIFGRNYINSPILLITKFMGVIGFVFLAINLNHYFHNPITKIIRFWYPFTLLEFFFTTATHVDLVFNKNYLDPIFQNLDQMIFGYQPALDWGINNNNFFIQEFFHFSYFSYYLMIFGIPLFVYLKKGKAEFIRVLFNILFVFVSCYILYMFLPVIGGRALEGAKELTETYRHGLFTHIMVYIYRGTTHFGGAFPSSHVAVALTISLLSIRYFRVISWILIINTFFLAISTVFCHYHYFVDTLAGVVYGIIMFGVSEIIYSLKGMYNEKFIEL